MDSANLTFRGGALIVGLVVNALLTGILVTGMLLTALFAVFLCKTAAVFREFILFLTPPGENQPSPAAVVWAAMAETLNTKFKMTLLGLLSVEAKKEKRLEGDILTQALAEKSPLAGAALQAFPGLAKFVRRNPGLLEAMVSKVASAGKSALPEGDSDFARRLGQYS